MACTVHIKTIQQKKRSNDNLMTSQIYTDTHTYDIRVWINGIKRNKIDEIPYKAYTTTTTFLVTIYLTNQQRRYYMCISLHFNEFTARESLRHTEREKKWIVCIRVRALVVLVVAYVRIQISANLNLHTHLCVRSHISFFWYGFSVFLFWVTQKNIFCHRVFFLFYILCCVSLHTFKYRQPSSIEN